MSLAEDLYKEIILEYSQNLRHFGELDTANIHEEGVNRSCGDEVCLHMELSDNELKKIRFTGHGCSICMASTEMMCNYVENKSIGEIKKLIHNFKEMILSKDEINLPEEYEELESLKGVRKFPIRVKCATLSWNTLEQALR